MANEKRLIPLQRRLIYAGDVLNSLMSEKSWSVTEAADFIKAFRTADAVEVVHGRWEEYQVPHIMCCSECDWATGVQDDFNYCPNCGAKMDGGKDNEID